MYYAPTEPSLIEPEYSEPRYRGFKVSFEYDEGDYIVYGQVFTDPQTNKNGNFDWFADDLRVTTWNDKDIKESDNVSLYTKAMEVMLRVIARRM